MNISAAATVLGLDPSHFTAEDVEKAFRKAALRNHPDKGGSSTAFVRVTQAAETLRDSLKEPSDYGLDMLIDSLGAALQKVKMGAHHVQAIMALHVFCAGLAEIQASGRQVRLLVKNNVVYVYCQSTGGLVAEGVGFPHSAVQFFTFLASMENEFTFMPSGVVVLQKYFVSSREIAAAFC